MKIAVLMRKRRASLTSPHQYRRRASLNGLSADLYLPYVKQNKRSWETDEAVLRRHLLPVLGKYYLDEITTQMIVKMMTDMRAEGYANGTCNRPVIFLRYMLNLANDWGIPRLERNPAKKVQLFEEVQRQRFLSPFEMRALMDALKDDDNDQAAKAIELLLLIFAILMPAIS